MQKLFVAMVLFALILSCAQTEFYSYSVDVDAKSGDLSYKEVTVENFDSTGEVKMEVEAVNTEEMVSELQEFEVKEINFVDEITVEVEINEEETQKVEAIQEVNFEDIELVEEVVQVEDLVDGTLIQGTFLDTLYYFEASEERTCRYVIGHLDGTDYRDKVAESWFPNGYNIVYLSDALIATIDLCGNIGSRDGTWILDINNNYHVVSKMSQIQAFSKETLEKMYGDNWEDRVVYVPDGFWSLYQLVEPSEKIPYLDGTLIRYLGQDKVYYLQNGTKRLIVNDGFAENNFGQQFIVDVKEKYSFPDGDLISGYEEEFSLMFQVKSLYPTN